MKIELLKPFDFEELYNLELTNRGYFEQFIPPLGDDYYLENNYLNSFRNMLKLQEERLSIYYLIRDNNGNLLGKIDLVNINHETHIANLECKIAENYTGQGIATYSLKTLIDIIDKDLIKEIRANITHFNIGFQKVLEKNGFELIYINGNEFDINGIKAKIFLYFKNK